MHLTAAPSLTPFTQIDSNLSLGNPSGPHRELNRFCGSNAGGGFLSREIWHGRDSANSSSPVAYAEERYLIGSASSTAPYGYSSMRRRSGGQLNEVIRVGKTNANDVEDVVISGTRV